MDDDRNEARRDLEDDAELDDFLADVLNLTPQRITRVHHCIGIDMEELGYLTPDELSTALKDINDGAGPHRISARDVYVLKVIHVWVSVMKRHDRLADITDFRHDWVWECAVKLLASYTKKGKEVSEEVLKGVTPKNFVSATHFLEFKTHTKLTASTISGWKGLYTLSYLVRNSDTPVTLADAARLPEADRLANVLPLSGICRENYGTTCLNGAAIFATSLPSTFLNFMVGHRLRR